MKIRFGICGLGFAGSVLMAPAMRTHPRVEIVGACDPNTDVRARFGIDYGVPTWASLQEMIAKAKLDAVYIASPHHLHCEHTLVASKSGLHILVEKPLTLNLADADRMMEAVRRNGVQLVVGTSRSHDPVVKTMREIVLSGEVGRVAMINCWNYTDFLYRPRRPEDLDTSKGGGIVFNQLPHQIDCVKAIANQEVKSVRASAAILDPSRPTEGAAATFLTLSGGVVATLVYSGYDHFDSDELHFGLSEGGRKKQFNHGSARRLLRGLKDGEEATFRTQRYGYGGPVAKAQAAGEADRRQPHFGIMIATCERADLRPSPDGVLIYGDDGVREVPAIVGRGSFSQGDSIDELCNAIAGEAPALRDAKWGRNTLAVSIAILESSRTGREVHV